MTAVRTCAECAGSLESMRSHAKYCSRRCKTKASDRRRTAEGRGRVRDRARYPKEAEHRRAYAMQYLADNPDRCREYRRKRKALIRGASASAFSDADWRRTCTRYRNCCAYCGRGGLPLTMDHVVPIARGGRHSIGNVVPACEPCNFGKHTSLAIEWIRRLSNEGR